MKSAKSLTVSIVTLPMSLSAAHADGPKVTTTCHTLNGIHYIVQSVGDAVIDVRPMDPQPVPIPGLDQIAIRSYCFTNNLGWQHKADAVAARFSSTR